MGGQAAAEEQPGLDPDAWTGSSSTEQLKVQDASSKQQTKPSQLVLC